MDDCIFCRILAGDIPSDRVYEDADAVAFRDVNPQAPVHVLLVPRRHVRDVSDCARQAPALLGKLSVLAAQIAAAQGLEAGGYRLVTNCGKDAAQSVPHFHIHILGGQAMTERMA